MHDAAYPPEAATEEEAAAPAAAAAAAWTGGGGCEDEYQPEMEETPKPDLAGGDPFSDF